MAITPQVRRQLFEHRANSSQHQSQHEQDTTTRVIRLPPTIKGKALQPTRRSGTPWTEEEHERFLKGLEMFPAGPWKEVAAYIGSRSARQTMTHAQKYREKIARNTRGTSSSDTKIRHSDTNVACTKLLIAESSLGTPENADCGCSPANGEELAEMHAPWVYQLVNELTSTLPVDSPFLDDRSVIGDHEMVSFLMEALFTDANDE